MTKAELIAAVADKSGLNKNQAKDALEAVLGAITDSMKTGAEVRIVGFGNFVPVDRPGGHGPQPPDRRTGEAPSLQDREVPAGRGAQGLAELAPDKAGGLTWPVRDTPFRSTRGCLHEA